MLINKIKRTIKKKPQNQIIQTTTKEATCIENGSCECYCTLCGKSYTETIYALGHNYNSGYITQEATCTENGIKTFTCTRCNDSYTEVVAALGHDYASDFTIDTEPTCTINGSKSKHCSRCDSKTGITSISSLGHDYGAWTTVTPATCTATGIKQRTCSRCGAINTDIIPMAEHNFVNGTCTNCGLSIGTSGELADWRYTLDNNTNKVTLYEYMGTDTEVTVHNSYYLNNIVYQSAIGNAPNMACLKDYMFANNETITKIVFEEGIDTSNTTDINCMFSSCTNIKYIDMSNLVLNNITNILHLFNCCYKLETLYLGQLNTKNVLYMTSLFFGCNSLKGLNGRTDGVLDLSNWDTSNVKDMATMFCFSNGHITCIDLRNWDTHKVKNMRGMFFSQTLEVVYATSGKWSTTLAENTTYGSDETGITAMWQGCNISSVTYA